MSDAEQREVLQFVVTIHRKEMERHQKLVGNVFYWTLTIILGLGVALIQLAGSDGWQKLNIHKWPLKLTISATCVLIAVVAIIEMLKRLAAYDTNARIVVKASKLLHLFDENRFGEREPLYDRNWEAWGDRNHPAHKFVPVFHTTVLLLVAAAASIIAWST